MTLGKLIATMPLDQYIMIGAEDGAGYFFAGSVQGFLDGTPETYTRRDVTDSFVSSVPGEPYTIKIIVTGKEKGKYWTISDVKPEYKHEPRITNWDGFWELRAAIALRACSDCEYKESLGAEEFLRSDYGQMITGADGDKVISVCRTKARYNAWRKAHGCGKKKTCTRTRCRHYTSVHFLDIDKPGLSCPKEKEETDAED